MAMIKRTAARSWYTQTTPGFVKAGDKPNLMPYERRRVEKDLELAATNGAPAYQARHCLHLETRELYTLLEWVEVCADGKSVRNGNAIDLQALRKVARILKKEGLLQTPLIMRSHRI